MTYETGDAQDIWEAIFSGNKIELEFSSNQEAERLRVRLYQIKKKKETKYLDLGMMNDDDVQSLIFEPVSKDQSFDLFKYTVYLGKRKREAKQFQFRILETPTE